MSVIDIATNIQKNIPIQMVNTVNTSGDIKPVSFLVEDSLHNVNKINISRIISHKEMSPCGIPFITYICEASNTNNTSLNNSIFFELRYYISTHKWTLFQILN